jgi:hypothetical protein
MVATRRATTEDVDVIGAIAVSAFERYTDGSAYRPSR